LPFFLGQALIREAAARETRDEAKAALLASAFRLGAKAGLLPIAAALQEKTALSIAPSAALRPMTAFIAQILLLRHQADGAERWREILDLNSDTGRPLGAVLAVELDLVSPNPGRAARAQMALSWLVQNALAPQPLGGAEAQRYAALVLGLYETLGQVTPPEAQTAPLSAMHWPGRELAPALLKHLGEMQDQPGMKGEAILTVLDAVGAQGPGDFAPEASVELVRALKALGERDAARALAVDALLLYQPAAPGAAAP